VSSPSYYLFRISLPPHLVGGLDPIVLIPAPNGEDSEHSGDTVFHRDGTVTCLRDMVRFRAAHDEVREHIGDGQWIGTVCLYDDTLEDLVRFIQNGFRWHVSP